MTTTYYIVSAHEEGRKCTRRNEMKNRSDNKTESPHMAKYIMIWSFEFMFGCNREDVSKDIILLNNAISERTEENLVSKQMVISN